MKKVNEIKKTVSLLVVSFILISFFLLPLPFLQAITSPHFSSGRLYPLGLIEDGSLDAGLKGRSYEYAHLPTSEWTEMVADLQSGNHMLRAELFNFPGTPLPLSIRWCTCYYSCGVTSGPSCRSSLKGTIIVNGKPTSFDCPLTSKNCGCVPVPR